jgi:hypothetical protein
VVDTYDGCSALHAVLQGFVAEPTPASPAILYEDRDLDRVSAISG